MPTKDPTGPPDDLDVRARALYRALRKALQAAGRWEDTDQHILGQTCRYSMRARLAVLAMFGDDGRPCFEAEGYKGQAVQSPSLKTAEAAEKSFVEGLRELGFTPAARARLHLEASRGVEGGKFSGVFG